MARPRIEIPRRILEEAARRGWSLRDIQRDMRRLGVTVSAPTISERLGEAGIRLVRQYNPATPAKTAARFAARQAARSKAPDGPRRRWRWGSAVVGRRPDTMIGLHGEIGQEEMARSTRQVEADEIERRAQIADARAGDVGARLGLVRRWGCRVFSAAEIAAENKRRSGEEVAA